MEGMRVVFSSHNENLNERGGLEEHKIKSVFCYADNFIFRSKILFSAKEI
jgi:hypothetical protein